MAGPDSAGSHRRGELVRHRVRLLATSATFAVSLFTIAVAPAAQAGAGPAAGASWPQFQGNAAHTGLNTRETTLDTTNVSGLELSWVGLVPGQLPWTSPVIVGDSVYIAGGHAGLVVFPKDGCGASTCDPSWIGDTGPQAEATPAVANGRVYVISQTTRHSNNGRLYVFDANGCGQPVCHSLWRGLGGTSRSGISSPAVAGGVVFVGSYDGMLYAFDANGCGATKCMPLWTAHVGDHVDSSPAVAGGMVYVGPTTATSRRSTRGAAVHRRVPRCGERSATAASTSPRQRSPAARSSSAPAGSWSSTTRVDAAPPGVLHCGMGTRSSPNTPAVANGIVYIDAQPFRRHFTSLGVVEAFDVDGCGEAAVPAAVDRHQLRHRARIVAGDRQRRRLRRQGSGIGLPGGLGRVQLRRERLRQEASCAPIGFAQTGEQQFYLASSPAVVDGRVYMGSTDTPTDQAGLYVFALPGG